MVCSYWANTCFAWASAARCSKPRLCALSNGPASPSPPTPNSLPESRIFDRAGLATPRKPVIVSLGNRDALATPILAVAAASVFSACRYPDGVPAVRKGGRPALREEAFDRSTDGPARSVTGLFPSRYAQFIFLLYHLRWSSATRLPRWPVPHRTDPGRAGKSHLLEFAPGRAQPILPTIARALRAISSCMSNCRRSK